jgi:prolyl-tRNA synthetase
VYLLTVNIDDDYQYKISLNIYNDLISNGIEVLWDDRKESPGFKFKDWDLLGIPFSIIVGSKVKDNKVEIKVNKNFHKFFVNDIPLVLDVDISEVVQFFNRWRSL